MPGALGGSLLEGMRFYPQVSNRLSPGTGLRVCSGLQSISLGQQGLSVCHTRALSSASQCSDPDQPPAGPWGHLGTDA